MSERKRVIVEGMTCDHCEQTVAFALESAGAKDVEVSYRGGEALFRGGDDDRLAHAVEEAGYRAGAIEVLDPMSDAIVPASVSDAADWSSRRDSLTPAARAFYHSILRSFATGRSPTREDLDTTAAELEPEPEQALAVLEKLDLVQLDAASGEVVAAYPFSRRPTPHVVAIDGATAYAMCAVDALGIAYMLDRPVEIRSQDPIDAQPIVVRVDPEGEAVWEPREAVVFVGGRAGDGPAASLCCPLVNFFASRATAEAYAAGNADLSGRIVSMPEAIAGGRAIFGGALAPDHVERHEVR